MKVLIACEYSGVVRDAFLNLGHDAISCDLLPTDAEGPHHQGDIFEMLNKSWDMIIAFPPCTFLCCTGNRWFNIEKYGEKAIKRHEDREAAIDFFMAIANATCSKIAIENPIGRMSTRFRKPDQIIHPYYFGDTERKATCLWLKGLQPLKHDERNHVQPNIIKYKNGKGTDSKWHMDTMHLDKEERSKQRSKTFPGIANAMAEQWGIGE